MKTLSFIVDGEKIHSKLKHDFTINKDDYVMCQFVFSPDWDNMAKVAKFTRGSEEFTPQVLDRGVSCMIPREVLEGKFFRLSIVGRNKKETRSTDTIIVYL